MIKQTLCFTTPAHLSAKDEQLVIVQPLTGERTQRPIEDLGVVVLEHPQITISHHALSKLLDNNTAVIACDEKRMPSGLLMPLSGHVLQSARFQAQIEASLPLKKQLWQQTMQAKINNQAQVLENDGLPVANMRRWAKEVRSGDPDNFEARAAAYYWRRVFGPTRTFVREREGWPPNNLLNYAYAILRACTARSLVGSGLLPTLGIHHHNQYNAFCLADDVMEPYRPFADVLVKGIVAELPPGEEPLDIATAHKRTLLTLPVLDVMMGGKRSPLLIALQRTTATLAKCYAGELKKIAYPTLP